MAAVDAAPVVVVTAVVFGVAAAVMKLAYWRHIDAALPIATMESATGLGFIGTVRPLEAPHTEENYLLREMGYVIARKHAARLRSIALIGGIALPVVLLIIGWFIGGPAAMVLSILAALIVLIGIYIERWLFFAEATHTVTLYYGRREAA